MKIPARFLAPLLALPLMASTRCVDENEIRPAFQLPEATHIGANTLGFLIDGRIWRDYGTTCTGGLSCDSNKVRLHYFKPPQEEFLLYAGLTTKQHDEFVELSLQNVHQTGTYLFSAQRQQPRAAVEFVAYDNASRQLRYTNRPADNFVVFVTHLDTVQRILAGTFAGTLRESGDTTKTVFIESGRFDLTY